MNKKRKYNRHSIRLRGHDYSTPNSYFVTICTNEMRNLFGDVDELETGECIVKLNKIGEVVKSEWIKTEQLRNNVKLDEYVVMPNHFHGIILLIDVDNICTVTAHKNICTGTARKNSKGDTRKNSTTGNRPRGPKPNSIGAIIGSFKSAVSKRVNAIYGKTDQSIWQRNYYEHIIRTEQSLEKIRDYIHHNSAKWREDEYYRHM